MRTGSLIVLALLLCVDIGAAQEKKLLKSNGWGSLSGKVTLADGINIPMPASLEEKMKAHNDKACCLNPKAKPFEKIDRAWLVDKKTRGVANVVVFVKPPEGMYLPIHAQYQKRKDRVVIDQPHCAFLPYVSVYNPVYFDGAKEVATGQVLILKNSATVAHNVRAVGNPRYNDGFSRTLQSKTELNATNDLPDNNKLKPQPYPISLHCDFHTWMAAKLYVFDHPYYAVTKEDGSYEIPMVPAGAEVIVMAHFDAIGWALTNKGKAMTMVAGKNTLDIAVKE